VNTVWITVYRHIWRGIDAHVCPKTKGKKKEKGADVYRSPHPTIF
jgi:hypothetical protein